MSSENLQALEDAYERLMAISLNQAPMKGLEDLVDPEVMGYGTTIDEQIFDLDGYMTLIRNQEEQAEIDMQLDEEVGEVSLVAEDFSRVILNLTNNAFDAMREKSEK